MRNGEEWTLGSHSFLLNTTNTAFPLSADGYVDGVYAVFWAEAEYTFGDLKISVWDITSSGAKVCVLYKVYFYDVPAINLVDLAGHGYIPVGPQVVVSLSSQRTGERDILISAGPTSTAPRGERYCVDETTVAVWNSLIGSYDIAPCSAGKVCRNGFCVEPTAPPPPTGVTPPAGIVDCSLIAWDFSGLYPFFQSFYTKLTCPLSNIFLYIESIFSRVAGIFTAIQNIPDTLDAWASRLVGVDPALPFWDELEKKLISMLKKAFTAIIDDIFKDFKE